MKIHQNRIVVRYKHEGVLRRLWRALPGVTWDHVNIDLITNTYVLFTVHKVAFDCGKRQRR